MKCKDGVGCEDCGGGAEVGAGYGKGLSLPKASCIEGRDFLRTCLFLLSPKIPYESGDDMLHGCSNACVDGASKKEKGSPACMALGLIRGVEVSKPHGEGSSAGDSSDRVKSNKPLV